MTMTIHDNGLLSCADMDAFFTALFTYAQTSNGGSFVAETVSTPQTINDAGTGATGTGATSYKVACLSRGGVYWWFRYSQSAGKVYTRISTSLTGTGTNQWWEISNKSPSDTKMFPCPAAGNYRFIRINDTINAVCILSSGVHVHLNFGKVDTVGAYTGGEYATSNMHDVSSGVKVDGAPSTANHRWMFSTGGGAGTARAAQENGVFRVTYDSKTYAEMDDNTSGTSPSGGASNLVHSLGGFNLSGYAAYNFHVDPEYTPNIYNSRSAGIPVEYFLCKIADDERWYSLGTIPGVRFVDMTYLSPADVINNDWVVYPLSIKGAVGSVGNYASSLNAGIAYRFQVTP